MPSSEGVRETRKHAEKDHQKNQLVIAFLICDEPAEPTAERHGGFDDILHNLLEPLLKEADPDLELVTKGFDVVYNRDYPSYEFLADVDAVVVSGSFVADAWVHTPWISRLAGYIVYLHDVWPQIRLCGICFGHQVIARAFGSDVGPMEAGWELGATKLQLTEAGRDVVSSPEDPKDILTIQQIHSDEVKSVPEGFELLASSKRCKVQIIAQRYPANEEPPNYKHRARLPPAPYCNIHIYAMQGHPEWGQDVLLPLIDEFAEDGKISKEVAEAGRRHAKMSDDAEALGRSLLRVMGVAHINTHIAKA